MRDLALGLGIEPARDFITKQQRGVRHQLKGEPEPSALATGENFDLAVVKIGQAGGFKGSLDQGIGGFIRLLTGAQSNSAGHAFFHREQLMGDAELGHIAELGRVQIAVFSKIPALPEDGTVVLFLEAGDDLHQRRLSAAGRTHDGQKVSW